jgi:hypothetical protein
MDKIKSMMSGVNTKANLVFDNKYVLAILKITIILYASILAPKLPDQAVSFLQSTPAKIVIVALIAFSALKDVQLSILLACAFVLSINVISGRGILESYANMDDAFSIKKNPQSLITPLNDIYPGCHDITLADLLEFFESDSHKLQDTVHYIFKYLQENVDKTPAEKELLYYARTAGLGYNEGLSDKNAPLIATMLLNHGYKFSETCQPPHE